MGNQKWSLGFVCFAVFFISASSADFIIRQVTDADYNNSTDLQTNLGVTSVLRNELPSSKIITISNFSVIKKRSEPYESSTFEVLGYIWRLVLNVKGNINDGGENHVSLYVRIEETDSLPSGWEVNVDLKLFVENKKLNKYLTVTDGTTKKFTSTKKEWGFGQLIPLSTFYDTNEGYILEDTCSFGAEIIIPNEKEEKVTFISNPPDNVFTWKILNFSTLKNKIYHSDEFLVGERYWKLGFNPKGFGLQALPLYLYAKGFKTNAVVATTWGKAYLRLKNQLSSNHRQQLSSTWYPIWSGYGVGVNNIISFRDLNNETKGYLVDDSIIIEVEMIKVSVTNILIRQVTDAEYNNTINRKTNLGVTSMLRDEAPSSKIVTISSFNEVKERFEPYQSSIFKALGYTWRLVLNAKGNINDGGANHVSLYVKIEETDSLPSDWEVNVDLKLFVQNKKLNKYLTVTDGTTKKFNSTKKQWGFGKLIPLSTFYDTNKGYIVQDTCSFGAEIVKPIDQQEKVTFISNPPNNIFTWKIFNFSNLEDKFYFSDAFLVEDRYWVLGSNPKGFGASTARALPIFLFATGFKPNATATTTWGETLIRLKNQRNYGDKQVTFGSWYSISSDNGAGVIRIIWFTDLLDESQGYMVNDTIIFEAEMITVSVTNIVSI